MHKNVKAHGIRPFPVMHPVQHRDELCREVVAERGQGFGVLVVRDGATAVFVEASEQSAPGSEEAPEAAGERLATRSAIFFGFLKQGDVPEFLKANGAVSVCIEHSYHHFHSLRIEAGEVSIDKRGTELILRELPRASFVHGLE